MEMILPVATGAAIVLAVLICVALLFKAFYYKVNQGTALIVNDLSRTPKVHFTGAFVYPVIYRKELMNISLITMEIDRRGKDGLICADNMRADITVAFYLRVNETAEDVLKVAKSVGAGRASDKDAVNDLFNAKFSEALKTVGKQIEFVKLFENRQDFRDKIIRVIGNDLNGYILEDVAIDYLEQTPKSSLDPNNILDAEGIRKITELTAQQNIRTNMLARDEELAITKKNVETREAMLELERQQADAEAKQQREIASIRAREEAEARKVQEEERKKGEMAHILAEQELAVMRENQQREVDVAAQNRERAVAVEIEKVNRARALEIVSREREVELHRIEAEKAVEVQKQEIANVIRERISVDKTVAIEEERIKEVREVAEADRAKQVRILEAEARAEEEKVRAIKAAEAEEQSAKHRAVEITTIAQARLDAAAKDADAKKKLAEGTQAEQAAFGLAAARVQEAQAIASEKQGMAEANIIRAKGEAQAQAERDIGMAQAEITREQFRAEADGLTEKFGAMDTMSAESRAHEEYRMRLDNALKESLAAIAAGQEIAQENARILAIALEKAKIDIVGGEQHFFDTFAKSLSLGKSIDGLIGKSDIASSVIQQLLGRDALPERHDEQNSGG
ncbi:MAG: hypothetical protein Q4D61_01725 [Cardiobacteriaceae bacterium]|nr:hypothetical protein [Cardiobacteriaceae bacterium]